MSAQQELRKLADRKRLLVLEAELQRRLVEASCLEIGRQARSVRETAAANRWWLLAAGIGGGLLFTRRWKTIVRWLPAVLAAWRLGRSAMRGK